MTAILGRALDVVTVEVVVDVPALARRRAGTVVLLAGAVVVVAVVTGRVLVDVKGRGRLVVVVVVVVTGRVRVDVRGRVWVAVVTGCVVVVAGAVPTPATGGRLNRFNRVGNVKILNLLIELGSIDRSSQFCDQVRQAGIQRGWRRG